MNANDPVIIQRITRNLRDFGYSGLREQTVKDAVEALLRGEKPVDIIGMMAETMLRQANLLEREEP